MTFDDLDRPPLDRDALHEALTRGASLWRRVDLHEAAGSTNALAAAAARDGEAEGLVVVADHQTAGRGRLDRVWTTPPGTALTFSVLLTPAPVPAERWPWLPLLTGVAVAEGVRRATGVAAGVKWPNDVLVDDRKVAGILVERVEGAHGPAAVVGVGLNVGMRAGELPAATATSLALEVGAGEAVPDRTVVLREVLRTFEALYLEWRGEAGDPARGLHASYLRRCVSVDREVTVELPDGTAFAGTVTSVDASGALVVSGTDDAGTPVRRTFHAGDVVHARRTP
ncbi:biotin--[acetyl-CoA-carboxylase] ligase [Nocardioides massiliensis]|uniref:biotin--[biotin carboxyl-carrier protein] ligase n=1 Tax=Nocardioides massiliensis TaxID=1325935 RepID=A0ABT9NVB1_9ACTN|nr:biotin--[acetyl-CoA-carboxylase] ligase [Nocardioides massiliensis]MDP9824222.1 BirA family biotin operon repressor/biotin-[acetyl-CoA-carboxylase] ligase [Nocardioides massiliensis]